MYTVLKLTECRTVIFLPVALGYYSTLDQQSNKQQDGIIKLPEQAVAFRTIHILVIQQ